MLSLWDLARWPGYSGTVARLGGYRKSCSHYAYMISYDKMMFEVNMLLRIEMDTSQIQNGDGDSVTQ
jgi:hypothetical protein